MHNRLAEEAAYFAAVDAGRDSAQEEITHLRAVNKELLEALENILNERGEDYGDCDYQSLWKAIEAAKPAIAHAKAKGQGGE